MRGESSSSNSKRDTLLSILCLCAPPIPTPPPADSIHLDTTSRDNCEASKRGKRERERGGEERERERGRERRIARGESSSAPRNFTAGYLCRAETRDRFQARMAERRIVWNSRFRKMEILGIPRYVSHGFRETATAVEFICTIICRLRSYSPCGGSATWMRASIYITVEIMINSIVCDEQCIRDVKGERSDSFLRRLHDQKTKGSKGGELVGGWTCLAVH